MALKSLITLHLFLAAAIVHGQDQPEPAQAAAPIPKLDTEGPTSFVTGLAFSPDGQTLYAAGWDKVVRVWRRQKGAFEHDPLATFRVPIGPGAAGQINSIALSADGQWLAVGGNSVFRHGSTFDRPGLIVPSAGAMDDEMREDQGKIFVFNVRTREVRQMRGHQGPIVALAFADNGPWLASAGQEWDKKAQARQGGLRLWDVSTGKQVAVANRLPDTRSRPGLALFRQTGQRNNTALPSVAIAWGDDRFRIWDPNTQRMQAADDDRYNNTIAHVPGIGLISGSASGLKIWQASERTELRARLERLFSGAIPRASTILPAAAGQNPNSLVAVAREPGREDDRLYLIDMRTRQPIGQPAFLWNGRGTQPAIAAAPTGDIAIAGGRDHRIVIYRADDLRKGRAAPRVLGTTDIAVRVAAIARQGKRLGIAMSAQAKTQPGQLRPRFLDKDQVFSVDDGAFVRDLRGWTIDLPAMAGWSVQNVALGAPAQQRAELTVSNGARPAGKIALGERQQVSDFALLPPMAPHNRPLLALAYFDFSSGQSVLALFDANSGERCREFLGHTGRISSVAFSTDGRFLTSAADDKTVCVWSLGDLGQVLAARGQLKGLTVDSRDGDKNLVVTQADRTLQSQGIAAEDLIEGVVAAEELRNIASPRELYQAISLVRPGMKIRLRRLRGDDRRDVELIVNQGVDERKPLFTFFSTPGPQGAASRWIGWTPLGPYEASDPSIETLLGWHFNTGRAETPVSFATVDQYRARFASRGLLQKLLETGRPQLAQAPEPEPPSLAIWLPRADAEPLALESGTSTVLRRPLANLEATSAPFPDEQVESIRWRLDDATGVFQHADGRWVADFNRHNWQRGNHLLEVELTTKAPPRRLTQAFTFVYQPAAPAINSSLPSRVESSQPTFDFEANVAPTAEGESVHARLMHQAAGAEPRLLRESNSPESLRIAETVKLHAGRNLLTLVAENSAAMNSQTSEERSSVAVEVFYNPPKAVPAPRFDLRELAAIADDGTEDSERLTPARPAVVHHAKVRLRGRVTGSNVLTVAQYRLSPAQPATTFAGFSPGTAKELQIEETLTLQPGVNRFVLQAQSGSGELTEHQWQVEYQPSLPLITAWPLPTRVFRPELQFVADLTSPTSQQPYELALSLNGQRLAESDLKLAGTVLTATIGLQPGDNRLELRLSNKWDTPPIVQSYVVRYIRKPRILELTSERKTDPEAVAMNLRVESELQPSAATVEVNGQPRRVDFDVKQRSEKAQWQVNLAPLVLEPGENRIRLLVADDQSESAPEMLTLNNEQRRQSVPEVVVLSQHQHAVLPDSRVEVEAIVRSTTPIQEVVVDDGSRRLPAVAAIASPRKNAQGIYEYLFKTAVSSGSDPKMWSIEAVNSGGRSVVEIPNAVIPQPVEIVLESVASTDAGNARLKLANSAAGDIILETALPKSTIKLFGHVTAAPGAADANRPIPIQVWVNGFSQKPVLAEPSASGELKRPFVAQIELTQAHNNLIEVGISDPDLPSESASRTKVRLDCANPNTTRRLHMLVIAVGAKRAEANAVRTRAVNAVQGTLKSPAEFAAPSFEKGVIHAVLLGSAVQRSKILFEIGRLARNLRSNDVAMIYYQGDVHEDAENFYLTTAATRSLADPTQTEISRDELNRWFGRLTGAQLILLDVDSAASSSEAKPPALQARWPADSHIAFFRFAWSPSQPGTPPNEPVLLTAWEQTARSSKTLSEIDSGLASFTAAQPQRYPASIVYERHLPPQLGALEFGATPGKP